MPIAPAIRSVLTTWRAIRAFIATLGPAGKTRLARAVASAKAAGIRAIRFLGRVLIFIIAPLVNWAAKWLGKIVAAAIAVGIGASAVGVILGGAFVVDIGRQETADNGGPV